MQALPLPLNGVAERRLRHLRGIIGRKLRLGDEEILLNSFFTLHEDTQQETLEKPFYISEVIVGSNNPHWCSFTTDNYRFLPDSSPSLTNIIVVVWESSSFPLRIVFKMRVSLPELALLGSLDVDLPENTIIFELMDGFYVLRDVRTHLEEQGIVATQEIGGEEEPKLSLSRQALIDLVKKKRELQDAESEVAELVSQIETKLTSQEGLYDQLRLRNEYSSRVTRMRYETQQMSEQIKKQREALEARKQQLQPRAQQLKKAQISLLASSKVMDEEQKQLQHQRIELEDTLFLSKQHTAKLIAQLRDIYRVEVVDDVMLSINGIALPNSFAQYAGCDEEKIATALGYVCHVTNLLSKYLLTPLRYPLVPMMSRSHIQDPISKTPISGKYPLYSKSQDSNKFEYGVFLLNKNIEQLATFLNVEINLRATLPNLKLIMDSFKLPEGTAQPPKINGPSAAASQPQ